MVHYQNFHPLRERGVKKNDVARRGMARGGGGQLARLTLLLRNDLQREGVVNGLLNFV